MSLSDRALKLGDSAAAIELELAALAAWNGREWLPPSTGGQSVCERCGAALIVENDDGGLDALLAFTVPGVAATYRRRWLCSHCAEHLTA